MSRSISQSGQLSLNGKRTRALRWEFGHFRLSLARAKSTFAGTSEGMERCSALGSQASVCATPPYDAPTVRAGATAGTICCVLCPHAKTCGLHCWVMLYRIPASKFRRCPPRAVCSNFALHTPGVPPHDRTGIPKPTQSVSSFAFLANHALPTIFTWLRLHMPALWDGACPCDFGGQRKPHP